MSIFFELSRDNENLDQPEVKKCHSNVNDLKYLNIHRIYFPHEICRLALRLLGLHQFQVTRGHDAAKQLQNLIDLIQP